MFSAPIKGRSPCYASLHWKEYGHTRTWHIHNTGKTLYRDRIVELLLQLENKQQIMQNNVETWHNCMNSLYIGSYPNGTLYLHRDFTGVRGNRNAMKHSIEPCLLYGQKTLMNSVQLNKWRLYSERRCEHVRTTVPQLSRNNLYGFITYQ